MNLAMIEKARQFINTWSFVSEHREIKDKDVYKIGVKFPDSNETYTEDNHLHVMLGLAKDDFREVLTHGVEFIIHNDTVYYEQYNYLYVIMERLQTIFTYHLVMNRILMDKIREAPMISKDHLKTLYPEETKEE